MQVKKWYGYESRSNHTIQKCVFNLMLLLVVECTVHRLPFGLTISLLEIIKDDHLVIFL